MIVSKTKFFLGLFLLINIPFFIPSSLWLIGSKKTTGVYSFQGNGYGLDQMKMVQSNNYFIMGEKKIWFYGPVFLDLQPGSPIPIRYREEDPSDARVYTFFGFWGRPITFSGIMVLLFITIFVQPGIIPHKAKIFLTFRKPFIRVIPPFL